MMYRISEIQDDALIKLARANLINASGFTGENFAVCKNNPVHHV
jgi:hypothetical protein